MRTVIEIHRNRISSRVFQSGTAAGDRGVARHVSSRAYHVPCQIEIHLKCFAFVFMPV